MEEKKLLLVLTAPGISETVMRCDAVTFTVPDGVNGKNGGSVGIRPGHASAMMALAPGKITAKLEGKCVLSAATSGGFVTVEPRRVTVLSDGLQIEQMDEHCCLRDSEI